MASVTVQALITDSLREIGVMASGQPLTPDLSELPLSRLNQIFDTFNAQAEASYVIRFETFTFIANQQDYTIGPTGSSPDFVVSDARPSEILGANVILDNVSPDVRNPIAIRDYQWWQGVSVRSVTTDYPTDLYYAPDWPLGVLHFWPKPTTAYGLELVITADFATVGINDTVNLPSGYHNAIMLTLAENIAPSFVGANLTPLTITAGRKARAIIFANNVLTPRLETQDAGMPRNNRNRCNWNYRTGMPFGRT